jgi:hypothetical protein
VRMLREENPSAPPERQSRTELVFAEKTLSATSRHE